MEKLGLVTVKDKSKIVMKIFSLCQGEQTENLKLAIANNWPLTATEAYRLALSCQFGCGDCLAVLTAKDNIYKGKKPLTELYRNSFRAEKFHPDWKSGQICCFARINISKHSKAKILQEKCKIDGVVHKVFFQGGVQSLSFDDERGNNSVGVVLPGKWDFGVLDVPETIVVVSGSIKINGILFPTNFNYCRCPLKAGEKIVFETEEVSAYLCLKGV